MSVIPGWPDCHDCARLPAVVAMAPSKRAMAKSRGAALVLLCYGCFMERPLDRTTGAPVVNWLNASEGSR